MRALIQASHSPAVQALIDNFYSRSEVLGFALGVHARFVSLFRGQFGLQHSVNDILADGRIPASWNEICQSSLKREALSPIYVLTYVEGPPDKLDLPREVGGYAVFAQPVRPFRALADRSRHRPILTGGISISDAPSQGQSGTLGGFCRDTNSGTAYLMGCSHVLGSQTGIDVLQQARGDGGSSPGDVVGTVQHAINLSAPQGWSFGAPYNDVDTALADLSGTAAPSSSVRINGSVGSIIKTNDLETDMNVLFVGKESDLQLARVSRFIARAKVDIGGTDYNFGDLFEIESRTHLYLGTLSQPGDSGAWVIQDDGSSSGDAVCGVLFAGNQSKAFCCPIQATLEALEATSGLSLEVY